MAEPIPIVDLLPEFTATGVEGITAVLTGDGSCESPWILTVSLKIDTSDPNNILAQTANGASAILPPEVATIANFEVVNGEIVYTYWNGTQVTVDACDISQNIPESGSFPPAGSRLFTKNADGSCVYYTMFPAGAMVETGKGDVYSDLDGNGVGQMGLKDLSTTASTTYTIPYDNTDNNWIIGVHPMSEGSACLATSGGKVYYNPTSGEFLTEPAPFHSLSQVDHSNDINVAGTATYANGNVYRQLETTISNNDACGRGRQYKVTYDWFGFVANLIGNAALTMDYQIKNAAGAWVTINTQKHTTFGNGGTTEFGSNSFSFTSIPTLNNGASRDFGMRLRVSNKDGTVSYVENESVYPLRMTVEAFSVVPMVMTNAQALTGTFNFANHSVNAGNAAPQAKTYKPEITGGIGPYTYEWYQAGGTLVATGETYRVGRQPDEHLSNGNFYAQVTDSVGQVVTSSNFSITITLS